MWHVAQLQMVEVSDWVLALPCGRDPEELVMWIRTNACATKPLRLGSSLTQPPFLNINQFYCPKACFNLDRCMVDDISDLQKGKDSCHFTKWWTNESNHIPTPTVFTEDRGGRSYWHYWPSFLNRYKIKKPIRQTHFNPTHFILSFFQFFS